MNIRDHILFEKDGILVLDKPAGLPSTGRNLEDPNCAQFLLMQATRRRVWAVHQLDAQTSGVNVFVRRKGLVDTLSLAMRQRGEKRYVAVCAGVLSADQIIEEPVGWDEERRAHGVVQGGQAAKSEVHVLATSSSASLLEVRIFTGRSHQIRLHLTHIGHPLLGDARYAPPEVAQRHARTALHAASLEVPPYFALRAPLPDDLCRLAEREGLAVPDYLRRCGA
ncbi:MAG: hypothetical protein AUK47_01725 [Deltaproteobacteria bacterium CG2_30_63_29]|nr:MAG: hypothetical protein AUK47_01725 [Deltaproteobacteria bacterium CG2_30_63_29]PJB45682.1 MAG: RNA pseudouridine synthase [Deltaproteobacteria bacterium CG_4_9_14_3_um_filter_63_12]